jgi:ubiquinone/menaquinone biosynthesis C-methylase UbiE
MTLRSFICWVGQANTSAGAQLTLNPRHCFAMRWQTAKKRSALSIAIREGASVNSGMLAVARNVSNGREAISWKEGSALDLPFPSGHFHVVLCQLGLQFFPNQPKALREMRRVVLDSGGVALSVYSPIERTPGANAFVRALDETRRQQ